MGRGEVSVGQPQSRPQKPCPPRGSLTRAAWTPVFPGALSPGCGWGWEAPLDPQRSSPRCCNRDFVPRLGSGLLFAFLVGGLSFVRAVLVWRGEEGEDPLDPSPQRRGLPTNPPKTVPPVTEDQVTGERQQTEEEELTQEPDQAGRVLATPPPGGPPPASPGPVPWAECLSGPSSGLRKRPTCRGQSPAHSETSGPPGTAGPCRPQTGSETDLGMWLEVSKGSKSCWGGRL